jgi:hypothetical protein
VADAQGYAYTRNLYYDDGTNRSREQSGVGYTHRIAASPQTSKTVKTYYGTASETELIRLFGDEAPAGESVIKTITIDQNGTASVSYTSKEGKAIATCLSFQDQSTALDALPNDATDAVVAIKDTVFKNFTNALGIISSKRLALLDDTRIGLSYQTACPEPKKDGCFIKNLNCSYDLWMFVKRVDGEKFNAVPFVASPNRDWSMLPGDSTVLFSKDSAVSCQSLVSFQYDTLNLSAGSYLIEKQLVPRNSRASLDVSQEAITKQIQPLTDMIARWLDKVKCEKGKNSIDSVFIKLRKLSKDLDDTRMSCNSDFGDDSCKAKFQTLTNAYISSGDLLGINRDSLFFTPDHDIDIALTGIPAYVLISSSCCKNLRIPIDYVAPFDLSKKSLTDKDGDTLIKVNPYLFVNGNATEFYPDFEGYAYGYFWDCVPDDTTFTNDPSLDYLNYTPSQATLDSLKKSDTTLTTAKAINKIKYIYYRLLKPYMQGYEQVGTFNLMVHHMLTDRYKTDGKDKNENPVQDRPNPPYDACNPTPPSPCVNDSCIQYTPQELFNCWRNQLAYIRDQQRLCPDTSGATLLGGPYKVSAEFDAQADNGGKQKHDAQFDNNFKGNFIIKWLFKRKIKKISKRMRELQIPNPPAAPDGKNDPPIRAVYNYHLVNEFLSCTGYRFAKILTDVATPGNTTPDEPLSIDKDVSVTPKYTIVNNSAPPAEWSSYKGKNRGYIPNGSWRVVVGTPTTADTLFSYIKDPVYAFKYFEYEDQVFKFLELQTCYSDPNYYYAGNTKNYICPSPDSLCNFCGIGKVKCDITKDAWTAGQRFTYYQMLKKYKKPAPVDFTTGIDANDYVSVGYLDKLDVNNANDDTLFIWDENSVLKYPTGSSTYVDEIVKSGFDTLSTRLKTKVEIDITALNIQLGQACQAQRSEYERLLRKALEDRCYIIGLCSAPGQKNIILEKDFKQLVNIMIEECKRRGQINTFSTQSTPCIDFETARTNPKISTITDINYGVAASGVGCTEAKLFFRRTLDTNDNPVIYDPNDTLRATSSIKDSSIVIYDCTNLEAKDLTYNQWIKRREVTEMVLTVDIAPAPGCTKTPAFACDTTNAGNSFEASQTQNNTLGSNNGSGSQPERKSKPTQLDISIDTKDKATITRQPNP